jgi:hypothetical protein
MFAIRADLFNRIDNLDGKVDRLAPNAQLPHTQNAFQIRFTFPFNFVLL